MDLEKLQNFVSQVKSLEQPRFTSRKLWLTIAAIGGFIYLFQTSLSLIVWPVTILAGLYLIINYLENRDTTYAKLEIKKALIESMNKDGEITEDESKIINSIN
jgi:CBS domain containing-hemolysin-like protein